MDKIAQQDVMDASGRGDSDYSGRGSMFIKPVAQPGVAGMNMASLAPMSRMGQPAAAVGQNAPPPQEGEEEGEEEFKKKRAAAAYATETFDFDSLFDGESLTEEFKEKVRVVFEAAVNERVNNIANTLAEQASEAVEQQVQQISEGLSQKLDDYLNYVIEEWMTENKLALEEGIRMDIAESFLSGLKELFESHYVSVPEGKIDILESVNDNNETLEKELNERVNENIALRKALLDHQCGIVFLEAANGLTDVQIEKLASLSQGLQYENVAQYAEKLNILKESYFRPAAPMMREAAELLEETTDKRIVNTNDTMGIYASAIARQAKKQV